MKSPIPASTIAQWALVLLALWGAWDLGSRAMNLIQSQSLVADVAETPVIDPTKVAPIPLPRPRPTIDAPRHFAQLASVKTKTAASKFVVSVGDRWGPLEIRRVELPNGVWFRVLVPVATAEAAQSICSQVIAEHGGCITLNF